ncbi:hypothetical protein CK203_111337 [Vitis vinifera]|uniref:Uncharacterized protein n=1 Tax=Vitis vinifera TaxID=29760 RepID=A0A438CRU0_VITVI|nr:hypothetical protein CK203_111337 [Vitis vinifera]
MSIDGRKEEGIYHRKEGCICRGYPNYNEWEVEDALVKSWLINSMTGPVDVTLVTKYTVDVCWKNMVIRSGTSLNMLKGRIKNLLRVTDHMISHSSLFDSLRPSLVKFVQVANGTPMSISRVGNVSLSPTLSMSSVLLAPRQSYKDRLTLVRRGEVYTTWRGQGSCNLNLTVLFK